VYTGHSRGEFQGRIIDFSDPESRADLFAAWPMGKIPLLRDDSRGSMIPETSVIIEYLDRNYPGPLRSFRKTRS